jgi:hypothetical protein
MKRGLFLGSLAATGATQSFLGRMFGWLGRDRWWAEFNRILPAKVMAHNAQQLGWFANYYSTTEMRVMEDMIAACDKALGE